MNSSVLTAQARSNFRHLYADIFWFGILAGSGMAFLAIYATRLGATSWQIGLLTAGPGVVNLLFSLPSGRWLEGKALIPATTWSAVLHRSLYLLIIPLPWLLNTLQEIWVIVLLTLLVSIPQTLLAISFNALFAEVVPAEARSEVVGKRNALFAVATTASTLVCGQLLDQIAFPLNYQIVFGLGVLGAALSTYHVSWLQLAAPFVSSVREQKGGSLAGRSLLRLDLLRGSFGRLMAAYLLFYAFQYLPISIFPLASVRLLDLTDGQISLGNGLFYGVMLLVSLRLSHLGARFGHRKLLIFSGLLFGIYPLLLGVAQDATLFWVASFVGGGIWALLGASMLNWLLERAPAGDRPASMALHNLALNLGIMAGSLAGPLLVEMIGLREALLLGAGLRLLGGLLMIWWG